VKIWVVILLVFGFISASNGQVFSDKVQNQIDSLNLIINNKSSHDTVIVKSMLAIVTYYYRSNPDTSITICKRIEKISEKINYKEGKSRVYAWLGYLIKKKGDIPLGLEYLLRSLKIDEELGNKQGTAICLLNIGNIYFAQGDVPAAIYPQFENKRRNWR